jgi:hypothetical protein
MGHRSDLLEASRLLKSVDPKLSRRLRIQAGPEPELWFVSWRFHEEPSFNGAAVLDRTGHELLYWLKRNAIRADLGEATRRNIRVVLHFTEVKERLSTGRELAILPNDVDGWAPLGGLDLFGRFIPQALRDIRAHPGMERRVEAAVSRQQQIDLIKGCYGEFLPQWLYRFKYLGDEAVR